VLAVPPGSSRLVPEAYGGRQPQRSPRNAAVRQETPMPAMVAAARVTPDGTLIFLHVPCCVPCVPSARSVSPNRTASPGANPRASDIPPPTSTMITASSTSKSFSRSGPTSRPSAPSYRVSAFASEFATRAGWPCPMPRTLYPWPLEHDPDAQHGAARCVRHPSSAPPP
jgi:hypothetical protein